MKLGLGLYKNMLTPENFRFAKQMGATHLIAHLTEYSWGGKPKVLEPGQTAPLWTYEELRDLRAAINAEGLELAGIENFDPFFWYDIPLDGPRKVEQMEGLKTLIRNFGRAGIPCIGYAFSILSVWGTVPGNFARGGAASGGYIEAEAPKQTPLPPGTFWSAIYDPTAPPEPPVTVSRAQMLERRRWFLEQLVPVAEEAGVRLAAHPDDPPMPELRGTARLIYKPELYQELFDTYPSHSNAAEFCQGTITEMDGEMNVYEAIDRYAGQGKIAYVHFRNVRGKIPNYREVFIDEGDVDMVKALRIYARHNFDGVMIPDHTPAVECAAPWHAGMAFALGYLRAAIRIVQGE